MTTSFQTEQTFVVPDALRYDVEHPDWCNKTHMAGADPRRQNHLNTWRSTHGKVLATRVELYPARGLFGSDYNSEPAAFVNFRYDRGESLRSEVNTVLRLRDLRSLAQRLSDIADAAEGATIAWADANGIAQWW